MKTRLTNCASAYRSFVYFLSALCVYVYLYITFYYYIIKKVAAHQRGCFRRENEMQQPYQDRRIIIQNKIAESL